MFIFNLHTCNLAVSFGVSLKEVSRINTFRILEIRIITCHSHPISRSLVFFTCSGPLLEQCVCSRFWGKYFVQSYHYPYGKLAKQLMQHS